MNKNLVTADYIVFIIYFIIVSSYGLWIYKRKKKKVTERRKSRTEKERKKKNAEKRKYDLR